MPSAQSVVEETRSPRVDPSQGEVKMVNTNGLNTNGMAAKTSLPKEIGAADRNILHVIDNRTGKHYTIPIVHNAINASEFKQVKAPENIDYYADQTENGIRIYDPGFANTAVSQSKVTYVDGAKGMIQYRGYSISDIVGKKGIIDTAYLLIWGDWPTIDQRNDLQDKLNRVPLPDQSVFNVIRSFSPEGSPLGMMIAGLSALQSTQMHLIPTRAAKNLYLGDSSLVDQEIVKFIANFAAIAAAAYCHHTARPFTEPRPELSYIENFFVMTGHVDPTTQLPNPRYVEYFERLWVLIANHEMTCSTAAFLQTASSLPDVISCMISALAASYGPLHGGAIEVAYKHIEAVGSVENAQAKIDGVKAGKERLFGYGHRIYRVKDPRSVFIRQIVDELSDEISKDPLLEVAFEIDRLASEDEYFISRKLNINADLYAAFAYKAMGFPPEFILPISSIARTLGFMAHWKEAMSGSARIWRPAQIYTGDLDKKMELDQNGLTVAPTDHLNATEEQSQTNGLKTTM